MHKKRKHMQVARVEDIIEDKPQLDNSVFKVGDNGVKATIKERIKDARKTLRERQSRKIQANPLV